MAHFAKIDDDNTVIETQVIADADIMVDGVESEDRGIEILEQLTGWSNWKKTSYNTYEGKRTNFENHVKTDQPGFRGNFAGPGAIWDPVNEIFYNPSSFPSWILNISEAKWEPPVARPTDFSTGTEGQYYVHGWNESNLRWQAFLNDAVDTSVDTHYWDADALNWVAFGS